MTRTDPRRRSLQRLAAVAAAPLAVVAAGTFTGATQAQAHSSWSSGWSTYSAPFRCTLGSDTATYFCLYYSPGAEGGVFASDLTLFDFSSRYGGVQAVFHPDRYGSAGSGQRVYHNAASAENNSTSRNLAVYSTTQWSGDVTWIPPGRGGNLGYYLRNKNGSASLG